MRLQDDDSRDGTMCKRDRVGKRVRRPHTGFTLPNLFIIGVPKAGTTSLARWLTDHPGVRGGQCKELRFLMDASEPLARPDGYHRAGLAGYGRYLPQPGKIGSEVRYLLDASPEYYYQEIAKEIIPRLQEAHVIIVLREPALRALSMFRYGQNNMGVLPRSLSFREFLEETQKARASSLIGERPMLRDVILHGEYARYLQQWKERLPASRLSVLLFEELVTKPGAILRQLSASLSLDAEFYATYRFPKENDSYAIRSRGLHHAVRRMRRLVPRILRSPGKRLYTSINTGTFPTLGADDRAALVQLRAHYARWNADLAELLGRDRPHWD